MRLERVAFDHPDAVALRAQMVAEVATMYTAATPQQDRDGGTGVDPASVVMTGVGYDGAEPVAHVTVRRIEAGHEIKRMFIVAVPPGTRLGGAAAPSRRGRRAARSATRGCCCTRGSGRRQPSGCTRRAGTRPIDLYPPYLDVPDSLCFAKDLSA